MLLLYYYNYIYYIFCIKKTRSLSFLLLKETTKKVNPLSWRCQKTSYICCCYRKCIIALWPITMQDSVRVLRCDLWIFFISGLQQEVRSFWWFSLNITLKWRSAFRVPSRRVGKYPYVKWRSKHSSSCFGSKTVYAKTRSLYTVPIVFLLRAQAACGVEYY